MIEAPKAQASRRQRRRVRWGMGRGVRSPADQGVWGSLVSSPSWIRGRAPSAIAFSAYFRPQNASGSKKNIQNCLKYCKFHFEKVVVTVTIVTYKVAPMLRPLLSGSLCRFREYREEASCRLLTQRDPALASSSLPLSFVPSLYTVVKKI